MKNDELETFVKILNVKDLKESVRILLNEKYSDKVMVDDFLKIIFDRDSSLTKLPFNDFIFLKIENENEKNLNIFLGILNDPLILNDERLNGLFLLVFPDSFRQKYLEITSYLKRLIISKSFKQKLLSLKNEKEIKSFIKKELQDFES